MATATKSCRAATPLLKSIAGMQELLLAGDSSKVGRKACAESMCVCFLHRVQKSKSFVFHWRLLRHWAVYSARALESFIW